MSVRFCGLPHPACPREDHRGAVAVVFFVFRTGDNRAASSSLKDAPTLFARGEFVAQIEKKKLVAETDRISPFKVLHAARVKGIADVVVISLLKDGTLRVSGSAGGEVSTRMIKDGLKFVSQL